MNVKPAHPFALNTDGKCQHWRRRLVSLSLLVFALSAMAQPSTPTRASLVGNWTNQAGTVTTRLDLRPNGRFVFARQDGGRTQASMGPYRIADAAIELNPDTQGARRLAFDLLDANTLRVKEAGAEAVVLKRGQAEESIGIGPSSAAGSTGAGRNLDAWTNRFSFPTNDAPTRTGPMLGSVPNVFPPAEPPQQTQSPVPLPGSVPTPDWLAKGLANPPKLAPPTNVRILPPAEPNAEHATNTTGLAVGGLTEADLAMANAVIAENTLTLRLPGLGTSVDGPGPLTAADRLVLLALKFHRQRNALVPFGEMRIRLEQAEASRIYRQAGEEFWAWHRETAQQNVATQARGELKTDFGTYIAIKVTAKRKAANRRIGAVVASDAAWRRAMESDQKTRDRIAQRADAARAAREEQWREWNLQAAEAAAAEKEWQLYLTHGAGHMDDSAIGK